MSSQTEQWFKATRGFGFTAGHISWARNYSDTRIQGLAIRDLAIISQRKIWSINKNTSSYFGVHQFNKRRDSFTQLEECNTPHCPWTY